MVIHTIGFTKKTAEAFFEAMRKAGVTRVIDVRLRNESQLAGFAKKEDLRYFSGALLEVPYEHRPEWAPTEELFERYKKKGASWAEYERAFQELLRERRIEKSVDRAHMDGACLVCTEDWPNHCHRRLLAEYLAEKWEDVEIDHLV